MKARVGINIQTDRQTEASTKRQRKGQTVKSKGIRLQRQCVTTAGRTKVCGEPIASDGRASTLAL